MSPTAQRRLLASLGAAALVREAHAHSNCLDTFEPPEARPGEDTTIHNGAALQDVCISHAAPYHVFVLGDWGGTGDPPEPANNRGEELHEGDIQAQQRVADQMNQRALNVTVDYVLNVGDSFYWGGIERSCFQTLDWSPQWSVIFNNVYNGPGLQGRPWLGVLGNHDYGGWRYNSGWGQIIAMSWVDTRWRIPAQFWSSRVHYPDFSIDYYFVDSNFFSCSAPDANPGHNMCSLEHNGEGDDCTAMGGPESAYGCPSYFGDLWRTQVDWLSELLAKSTATWRVVVTHIPPTGGEWKHLAQRFGIDLVVCGHVHYQRLYAQDDPGNPIAPSGLIVSGGGGGITAENIPDLEGHDDQYGFVDLTLSKDAIGVAMLSHGGQLRRSTQIEHCYAGGPGEKMVTCGPDSQASGASENKTAENETTGENETAANETSQASANATGAAADETGGLGHGNATTKRSGRAHGAHAKVAHDDDVDVDDSPAANAEEPEPTIFTSFLDRLKGLLGQSAVTRIALREESHPDVFSLYLMASVVAASSVTLSTVCWARRRVARRRDYSTLLLSEAA